MSFPWQKLTEISELNRIKAASYDAPQVIFKHSNRCNISSIALRRLEAHTPIPGTVYHFLDLINYRPLSNAVAELFEVPHESPQVLLISKGECIYDESHLGIQPAELEEQVNRIEA
jgi:bacillithiol system protein YtxJ